MKYRLIYLFGIISLSSILTASILLRNYPGELTYGLNEILSSQFLNSVNALSELSFSEVGWNAYLNGIYSEPHQVYSNFPITHFILFHLLFASEFVDFSYYFLLICMTSLLSISFAALLSTLLRFNFGPLRLFIIATLVLTNDFLFYSYTDLWWTPYLLFFISIQLWAHTYQYKKILYLFAVLQFYFTYEPAVYLAFWIIYGDLKNEVVVDFKKIRSAVKKFRMTIRYVLASSVGFISYTMLKLNYSGADLNMVLIADNAINIGQDDLIRFIYYYLLTPYLWIPILILLVSWKLIGRPQILFIFWGLVWFVIFPSHALHHAIIYSKLFTIVVYITIFRLHIKTTKMITFALLIALCNVFLNQLIYINPSYSYGEYKHVNKFISPQTRVVSNAHSYPATYYIEEPITVSNPSSVNNGCDFDVAFVIENYDLISVGASKIIYVLSNMKRYVPFFDFGVEEFNDKRERFSASVAEFKRSLMSCSASKNYVNHYIGYSVFVK
jgi:hypothetical protein